MSSSLQPTVQAPVWAGVWHPHIMGLSSLELLALGDGVGLSKKVWGKVPRMQHGLNHLFVKTSLDSLFKCVLA